jgi:hypothetical protein
MGHRYVVSVREKSRGHGRPAEDAMVPQEVEAEDVRQALHKAAALPLSRWYPVENEVAVRDYPT